MHPRRSVYLFNPPFIVRDETPDAVTVETASGRTLLLVGVVALSLLFGEVWLSVSLIVLSLIVWTYREVWTFAPVLRRQRRLLGIVLDTTALSPASVQSLRITESIGNREVDTFELTLELVDGRSLYITSRPRRAMLETLIAAIRRHIPDEIKIDLRED